MTKPPTTRCPCVFHYRVLTLVLLGGVEAFPTVYPHYRVLTLVLLGGVKVFPTVYPLKLEVLGGQCWFTLPKTCDEDYQLPAREAWSR
jgi:hypothetical protein